MTTESRVLTISVLSLMWCGQHLCWGRWQKKCR